MDWIQDAAKYSLAIRGIWANQLEKIALQKR
jgi:hypothetical protein